ncbi:TIGR00645 family protein [Homoserinimonas hongtaonis]|uniref:UPF0114 protein DF220_04540 n=1 Tax=Homoserinimonas hongtaonis TaxID=2079791 RepID=A0A2U1SZX0_9MICO|nr:TIGR00645 family protein [Salinibacterium hongtaonis]PWB97184.1 hypothetical protein DF220_04540 [Salinibacterium hongtaonis]
MKAQPPAERSTAPRQAKSAAGEGGRRVSPLESLGGLIFLSRWLQAPLYLGLIVAQGLYAVVFINEIVKITEETFASGGAVDQNLIMLSVLGLVDVVMVANLVIMVVIGGYETFVSKMDLDENPDKPEWLSHVNANVLKTKLAMSIIGISSIHLLKTFIEAADLGSEDAHFEHGAVYTESGVLWQVVIHAAFILSAIGLAYIDRWGSKAEFEERELLLEEHEMLQLVAARDRANAAPAAHSTSASTTEGDRS